MSRDDPQLKLRLPQNLKDMVEQAAKDHGRSINAELVYIIEQSFSSNTDDEKDQLIESQSKQLEAMQALMKNHGAALDQIISRFEAMADKHLGEDNKKAP